jgi:hypothetical protein
VDDRRAPRFPPSPDAPCDQLGLPFLNPRNSSRRCISASSSSISARRECDASKWRACSVSSSSRSRSAAALSVFAHLGEQFPHWGVEGTIVATSFDAKSNRCQGFLTRRAQTASSLEGVPRSDVPMQRMRERARGLRSDIAPVVTGLAEHVDARRPHLWRSTWF